MNDKTIEYYNQNAESFYTNTIQADMHYLQDRFISYLPENSLILDAGCGSGRDIQYFLNHGLDVEAFDASEEMVRLSSELTGLNVRTLNFYDIDYDNRFDGIWSSASLLHIPKKDIDQVIHKLSRSLKANSLFYLSFKYGNKEEFIGERFFNFYDEESFNSVLLLHPEFELIEYIKTEDVRKDKKGDYWLNIFLRKKSE